MKITWLGHASFQIETASGTLIRTDPYDDSIGLPVSSRRADVVTVSHDHFDHNAVGLVPGNPVAVRNAGTTTISDVTFTGIASFHDDKRGASRGHNVIFVIEADGLRLAHLGDLGVRPDETQVSQIGHVDLLFVPVGGVYTIDAAAAACTMELLRPVITVPMHYMIEGLNVPIADAKPFLRLHDNVRRARELVITAETLPESSEVVVLEVSP